jgi:hypothetical protein
MTSRIADFAAGRCISNVGADCVRRYRRRASGRPNAAELGSKTVRLGAVRSQMVKVTLNGAGSSLFRKRGRLPVSFTIKQGGKTVPTQTLTFTQPKKKKH